MMPSTNPVQIPAHLRGEAGPDTLAELVADGRRMGRFWPRHTAAETADGSASAAGPGHGFQVSPRSAALLGAWLDREG